MSTQMSTHPKPKLDYFHKRDAIVAIGLELQRRGWQLFGYHADASDSMTDYFSPAYWDGIATHSARPGVVANVHASARDSGREITQARQVNTGSCPQCGGTGVEPGALTYEEAKANPRGQHALIQARREGATLMFPDVVSPLHYHGIRNSANPDAPYGAPICSRCHGYGHLQRTEYSVIGHYPTYQENPPHRNWHVEKDGKILASGTGLAACVFGSREDTEVAIRRLVDQMEAAATPTSISITERRATNTGAASAKPADCLTPSSTTIAERSARGGIEVHFASKPGDTTLKTLKGLGFRWTNLDGGKWWYAPRTEEQRAATLAQLRTILAD